MHLRVDRHLLTLPAPTPQRGLLQFRHSKARVKSSKEPSCLTKEDGDHGAQGMLEGGPGLNLRLVSKCRAVWAAEGPGGCETRGGTKG